MEARVSLSDLGFRKITQSNSDLVYAYEDDYVKVYVHFNLTNKTYMVNFETFIDRHDITFVPMKERPVNQKHTCAYGHWQSEMYVDIGMRLHNAIHKQLIELGWIK